MEFMPDLSLLTIWRLFLTLGFIYLLFQIHRQVPRFVNARCSTQQRRTIEALATAINAKDNLTFDHVRRVQIYAIGLGRLAGCTNLELRALYDGALLHDVGKIGVPDAIITKRGKLTAPEFEQMKMHTVIGADILGKVKFEFPLVATVRHHHERWDGNGYPDGLKGEDIPLSARVLSIADCFDAVREDRSYRKGMTRQEAVDLILEGSGTQFDPRLVGLFLTNLPSFEAEIRAERVYSAVDFGINPVSIENSAGKKATPAAGLAT